MKPRCNWFNLTFVAILNCYWGSLAWLLAGRYNSLALVALSLVILAAITTSVLRIFQKNSSTLYWLLAGLSMAGIFGMLTEPQNPVKTAFLFTSWYLGVFLVTPLLLNKKYFWMIFFAGMLLTAYNFSHIGNIGYAIGYLVSGLCIAAWHGGGYHQQSRVVVIPIPLWQRVLWPMLFAFLLISSVLAVHSSLASSIGEIRDRLVNQVLSMVSLNKVPTYNVLQNLEAGGKINPSDILFMQVAAPYPDYWRGQSFDVYSGKGWSKVNDQVALIREEQSTFEQSLKGSGSVTQQFTLAGNATSEIFFTGYHAKALIIKDKQYSVDPLGELVLFPGIQAGETYRTLVEINDQSTDQLRQLGDEDWVEAEWMINYMQLPENLPDRVRTQARKIVTGLANRYDQVKAVEQYLKANYPYTLTIDKPPADEDMVSYFLFNTKKGYCTYHASAMAVMLRTLDIPTRLVTGFTAGKWQEEEGVFEVRDRDAHAWVEVYFPKVGWVPFEPTPSFQIPTKPVELAVSSPSQATSADIEQVESSPATPASSRSGWASVITRTVIMLIVLAGIALNKLLRRRQVSVITGIYQQLIRFLTAKGYPKATQLTPLEYLATLQPVLGESFPVAEKIIKAYLAELYGGKQLAPALLQELTNALKHFKRLKTF